MSDLGGIDTQCHATVRAGHCAQRPQCVLLHRLPGPRLLFGELMSELDDEAGIYLETHAKRLDADLISITVDQDDEIDESNERNNDRSVTIDIED